MQVQVKRGELGVATGIFFTMMSVGGAIGLAISGRHDMLFDPEWLLKGMLQVPYGTTLYRKRCSTAFLLKPLQWLGEFASRWKFDGALLRWTDCTSCDSWQHCRRAVV